VLEGLALAREHQLGEGPDEGVEAIGALAVGEAVGGEVAHLPLELGELADMGDATLGVEHGDGLGAQVLAAGGVYLLDRQVGLDGAEDLDHEVAALVGLHDDAVGAVVVVGGNGGVRPDGRLAALGMVRSPMT
jgi:hypothetical protein